MELKELARQIFLDTLARIDLRECLRQQMSCGGKLIRIAGEEFDFSRGGRMFLVGIGKACPAVCLEIEHLAGDLLASGVVVTNIDPPADAPLKLRWIRSAHPTPDERSIHAADEILSLLHGLRPEDLVVCVITGGGSAMAEKPVTPSITMDDLAAMNRALVLSAAPIREINIVRKHFSGFKGGRLALAASPARQVSLYVSDVNDEDVSSIASGPTSPDPSSLAELHRVIAKYELIDSFPHSIMRLLESASIPETPKPGDEVFRGTKHVVIASNRLAIAVAQRVASESGVIVRTDYTNGEGYYRDVADRLMLSLCGLKGVFPDRMVILISGGEAVCPVTGKGVGGRNQEMALYAATKLGDGLNASEAAFLACGTDGIDGNSDAAGAVADLTTNNRGRALGLDVAHSLADNDSYHYFQPLGDLVTTGPTGNNVRDLRILIAR